MMLKNVTIDTTDMSYEKIDAFIQNLRTIRTRKKELKNRMNEFCAMVANMRDEGMSFVSKTTGEILNPDDWELYDETTHSFYHN